MQVKLELIRYNRLWNDTDFTLDYKMPLMFFPCDLPSLITEFYNFKLREFEIDRDSSKKGFSLVGFNFGHDEKEAKRRVAQIRDNILLNSLDNRFNLLSWNYVKIVNIYRTCMAHYLKIKSPVRKKFFFFFYPVLTIQFSHKFDITKWTALRSFGIFLLAILLKNFKVVFDCEQFKELSMYLFVLKIISTKIILQNRGKQWGLRKNWIVLLQQNVQFIK